MKNKILTVSIIFILLSFTFISNNVFASDTTFTFTDRFGNEHIVPAFPLNEELGINSSCHYAIVTQGDYKDSLYIASGDGYFYGTNSMFCSTTCYVADLSNGQYVLRSTICSANVRLCGVGEICYFSGGLFIAKDTSTYTVEPMGNFFFHQITLAESLEMIQVQEMWKTLMKNVVVSLVVFLVGLVAFLKAWNWLKTQLHKA